jgi:CubicO group peptidase (beta-lactamase class C family)
MSVLGVNAVHLDNVRSVTRNLRNLPSTARPGEKYQYSNIMYAVATHIVEVLSGQTFSAFPHENVLQPLSMESTFLQPSEVFTAGLDSHFATPYFYANDKYHQAARQETPEVQGAGSIQTTPSDDLKFIAAMLEHDKLPITKSIYDAVTNPRVMRNGKGSLQEFGPDSSDMAYALGWDIKYRSGQQIIAHDGVITGFGSRIFFLPGRSFGAVMMGNRDTAFGVSQMLQTEMIEAFLNIPQDERYDGSQGRLMRQAAQEARKIKKQKRNEERRAKTSSAQHADRASGGLLRYLLQRWIS